MADFLQLSPYKCLEHKQLSRGAHQCPTWDLEKRSCHGEHPKCSAPARHCAKLALKSPVCRGSCGDASAPCGHSTHRPVAPAPPDGDVSPWAWPARVYKAITACPGSWIIRVRVDTMQVGCVPVFCSYVLQAFYYAVLGQWTVVLKSSPHSF